MPNEEVKDFSSKSLTNHEGSKRFIPNGSCIFTTPQRVHSYYSSASFSFPSNSWEAEDFSSCTSTPQQVFTIPSGSNNQDYSCTYPSEVKHANTVEKGRDSNRERDQGQLRARASPKKVEKEVKKTRGTSRPEKFEARIPDGHHRDYILLMFIGLAYKSTLICFSFFFFNDSRIASHLPFACKWQNKFWDNEPIIAHFPSNRGGTLDI